MSNFNFGRASLILGCGAILAIGMVASSFALSRFMIKVRQQQENTISAKGLAERKLVSDLGAFDCNLRATGATQEEAYQKLEDSYTQVKNALRTAGLSETELEENAPDSTRITKTVKVRDLANNREITQEVFSHYLYTRTLRIVSPQVDLVHKQSIELPALVLKGIDLEVCRPEFYIADLEKYKLELIAEATDSAMKRAQITAEKCNSKLGRLITARNGIIQITRPASSDMSDYGHYDTSSREKIMKIVVSATFEAD